jgi:DNA-binding beta-propeller fold protein YncE
MSLAIRPALSAILVAVFFAAPAFAQTDPPSFQFSFGEGGAGDGQLAAPRAIDIRGNEVYVLEYGNRRVSVFDLQGNFLRNWGGQGTGDGQLSQPQDILVTPAGEVYISDFGRHDIQVFDLEGNYLRKWGGPGQADSLLAYPWGMDADDEGNIWVSDRQNQALKKFTPEGEHLRTIDPSQINGCTSLTVIGDRIHCAMWGNAFNGVRIVDVDGNFIDQVGGWGPATGIDLAPNGDLYLTAMASAHRAYVVDPAGLTLVTDWGGYGTEDDQLADPWDIAVSAAGAAYIPIDDEGIVKVFSYSTAVEPVTWGRLKSRFR